MRRQTAVVAALLTSALPAFVAAQNQAVQLRAGIDGGISVPYDPALVPPTGLTVEAWVSYDDSTVPTGNLYWPTIARQNITPRRESWLLRVDANDTGRRDIKFSVVDQFGTLHDLVWSFPPGALLPWAHLAASFDGEQMRIFHNGSLVATRGLGFRFPVQDNGGVLRIGDGDRTNPGRETWHGRIDELRIWPVSRMQGEIQQTMNQRLSSMPGKVLTFNFDGDYADSSHGLVGVPDGQVAFVPGHPSLTPLQPNGSASLGQSTNTCGRSTDTLLGSLPTVGNRHFAVWAADGPPPATTPANVILLALRRAPGTQPPVFGIRFAVDLGSVVTHVMTARGTFHLGTARTPIPIPGDNTLIGARLAVQYVFIDTACGPQGVSSSDGMQIVVQ